MSLTVYVEGGGQNKDLRSRCREAFHRFLDPVVRDRRKPRIVACGSRRDAYDRFRTAMSLNDGGDYLLLVDSEAIVRDANALWGHVAKRDGDGWVKPERALEEHLHFMATSMESWLIGDPESLRGFFGGEFRPTALPGSNDLETVEREAAFEALRRATESCSKQYAKGKISFAAFGAVNAATVRKRLRFCDRLLKRLEVDG